MNKGLEKIEKAETERQDCFLCNPNPDLVYLRGPSAFLMSGLGSISPGYSIVSTYGHIHDLSSLNHDELGEFVAFSNKSRRLLSDHYGDCLLTEHGKIPLCNSEGSEHCFHPHFLLFPNANNITDEAKNFFGDYKELKSLEEAIEEGFKHKNYYLISPNEHSFLVFPSKEELPRQFLRVLVADSFNSPQLANWRKFPNIEEALQTTQTMAPYVNGK